MDQRVLASAAGRVKRKPLRKGLRFEVFDRDGFRCRYCGAGPDKHRLVVDHALAVANGGSNDLDNLVTACEPCNQGKGKKVLGQSPPLEEVDQEALQERMEQIKGLIAKQRALAGAHDELLALATERWLRQIGPLLIETRNFLSRAIKTNPIQRVLDSIEVTGFKMGSPSDEFDRRTARKQGMYFGGVLRKKRAAEEG